MDQGGGLEGLAGILVGEFLRGEAAQLVIDQRQEFPGGLGVALRNRAQDARNLAHRASIASDQRKASPKFRANNEKSLGLKFYV